LLFKESSVDKKIILKVFGFLGFLGLLVFSWPVLAKDKKAADVITSKNFEKIKKYVLPEEAEITWQTIPWLSSLMEGVVKAQEEKKPVFLWAMNGHPLGCT
jgi:hypothetical protein